MDIKLSCSNKNCNYQGSEDYVMCIPAEAVMDEHNMATVFCPHCAQELCNPDSCKPIDNAVRK